MRDIVIGDFVPNSELLCEALISLEYFIPNVLREIHSEWVHESLDGIFPELAAKTAENEIEIVGTCLLISDQTLVPIQIHIRVSDRAIEFMECKLGELVDNLMKRVPYGTTHSYNLQVAARLETIQWAYHVAFGLAE